MRDLKKERVALYKQEEEPFGTLFLIAIGVILITLLATYTSADGLALSPDESGKELAFRTLTSLSP